MNAKQDSKHDVVILGGGLAGLTLALQLKQRYTDLDILGVERRAHPVPAAAHKVGESSVEIGAHYFDTVLGADIRPSARFRQWASRGAKKKKAQRGRD
jgi:2-polyprenyl-6-methoxyphenol hydroxylase-like FAD-dependent oxidoreductase